MKYVMLILFFVSYLGWCLFLNKQFKLSVYFTPIITIAISFVLLFLGGMANILNQTAYVLFGLGFIMLALSWKKLLDKKVIIPLTIYLILLFMLLVFRLRGEYLNTWDDFVQWASSVKTMLINGRLPDLRDSQFLFATGYPYGSSLWIYYVGRIVGDSESILMLAQCMISCGSLFAVYSFIEKFSIPKIVIYILFVVYSLTVNVHVTSLYVDTIMPLLCLAGISIIIKQIDNKEIFMSLILIMLCQTKTNSIFFVVVIIMAYLIVNKEINIKKRLLYCLLYGLVPVIIIKMLWSYNHQIRFETLNVAYKASQIYFENTLSTSNLQLLIPKSQSITILGGKTIEQALSITLDVIKNYFNLSFFRIVNIWIVLIIVVLLVLSRKVLRI